MTKINKWTDSLDGFYFLHTKQIDIWAVVGKGNHTNKWYVEIDYTSPNGYDHSKKYKRAYKSIEAAKKAATRILVGFYEKTLKERTTKAKKELKELKKL